MLVTLVTCKGFELVLQIKRLFAERFQIHTQSGANGKLLDCSAELVDLACDLLLGWTWKECRRFFFLAKSILISPGLVTKGIFVLSKRSFWTVSFSVWHYFSHIAIPPLAVLNLMPKSPLGPPGLWLAVRMIPPMALYFLITQDTAGVDIIPWWPMIRRPICGNVTWDRLSRGRGDWCGHVPFPSTCKWN